LPLIAAAKAGCCEQICPGVTVPEFTQNLATLRSMKKLGKRLSGPNVTMNAAAVCGPSHRIHMEILGVGREEREFEEKER
jgi:hypothetical protein